MVARSPTLSLCVAVYYTREASVRVRDLLPALKVKVRSRVTETSSSTRTCTRHSFSRATGRSLFDCMNYPLTKAGTRKCCAPDKQASRLTD